MVDITSLVLLAVSFFFVAISVALLVRYRQASQRINASTDMGRDLWSSLEQRLKKQDERILDMMGRVEIIQARAMAAAASTAISAPPMPPGPIPPAQKVAEPITGHLPGPVVQQQESREESKSQEGTPTAKVASALDDTQLAGLRLLGEGPKNTRQLTDALGKSREHTARIMKGLFESGFVVRNDSAKPFVYQLTDEGRRHLASGA